MTDSVAGSAPTTEEEILEGTRQIKRSIRLSAFVSTPILILSAILFDLPTAGLIVVGAIVAYEVIGYPFMMRYLDKNAVSRIAEIREEQGLTPADQLPNVGI